MNRRALDSWFRLSVFYYEDERIARLNIAARELLVKAIAYAKRNRTDGRVPKNIMLTLYSPVNHETGQIDLKLDTKWITKWSPDGHPVVNRAALKHALTVSVRDTVRELVDEQLVTILDDGSYQIVNFIKWQETAEELEIKREKATDKKRKQRARDKPVPTLSPGDNAGTNAHVPTLSPGDTATVPGGQFRPDSDSDSDSSSSSYAELDTCDSDSETDALPEEEEEEEQLNGKTYNTQQLKKRVNGKFGPLYGDLEKQVEALSPYDEDEIAWIVNTATKYWPGFLAAITQRRADPDRFTLTSQEQSRVGYNGCNKVFTAPDPPDDDDWEAGARESGAIRLRLENECKKGNDDDGE